MVISCYCCPPPASTVTESPAKMRLILHWPHLRCHVGGRRQQGFTLVLYQNLVTLTCTTVLVPSYVAAVFGLKWFPQHLWHRAVRRHTSSYFLSASSAICLACASWVSKMPTRSSSMLARFSRHLRALVIVLGSDSRGWWWTVGVFMGWWKWKFGFW